MSPWDVAPWEAVDGRLVAGICVGTLLLLFVLWDVLAGDAPPPGDD